MSFGRRQPAELKILKKFSLKFLNFWVKTRALAAPGYQGFAQICPGLGKFGPKLAPKRRFGPEAPFGHSLSDYTESPRLHEFLLLSKNSGTYLGAWQGLRAKFPQTCAL